MHNDAQRKFMAGGLIALGILFLMVSNRIFLGWENVWPLFPLGAGLVFIRNFMSRRQSWLLFVGVSCTLLGAFLLLFSIGVLGWDRMSELWPFFPMLAGVAFLVESVAGREGSASLIVGSAIVLFTVVAFLVVHEVINPRVASPFVRFWPLGLVLAGIVLFRSPSSAVPPRPDPDMEAVREVLAAEKNPLASDGIPPGLDAAILDRVRAADDANAATRELVHGLKANFDKYAWVGLYRMTDGRLTLTDNDFIGAPPEHRTIDLADGICGACATQGETIIVPDVCNDPRYLACSPSVQSEIVVPVFWGDDLMGVLDIDSDDADAFHAEDRRFLEDIVRRSASYLRIEAPLT